LRALCLTIVLSLALLAPAAAWGQTPTDEIYDPADIRTGQDAGDAGDGAGNGDTAKAGTLPFSGSDVLLVVLAGSAVLGTGIVIRRASRTDS
jgi:hypothetical protein